MSNFAWVTLATNDSYSLGALVVAHSLKRVHTAHQLAVLITPGVSEAMKNKLRTIFNVVEEVNLLDSKDDANLALLKRPELGITFTKLHCWRLTQFEKCVFLDADTLVLRNCDELFEREELSAAPDVGWPDCFNSGVYVYQPSLETFSSLMQYAVTNGSFDGGDQGLLNSYFSDWAHKDIAKHLPFIYNTSSVASYSYLPAFKQFGQNTKILHFIGTAKPWLQNFNSESRQVHVPGGYQHLANFLQYWWDIFCEDVHSRLSADMSSEQWVDHAQRHDHSGHWDPQPVEQPGGTWQQENVRHDGSGGGGGGGDGHHHHHQPQQQQQHHQGQQNAPQSHEQHHQVDHSSGGGGEEVKHDHGGGDSGGSGEHYHQQWQPQHEHHQEHQAQGGGDGSGLAGALSQLHLGEPKSVEQETYEEHMRRQCWESGNIDYMGRDSFENIWRRIKQTVSAGPSPIADPTPATPEAPRSSSPAPPPRKRSSSSRSRSTTPKRDPRDRSPTPQPEDNVPVEKKEVQIEASIQEEDDSLNVAPWDASAERRKLPPPVQYDPMTSTTTLTKKVFAGYQQVITTKTQQGKTHTRTKTVYDPSVDDDDEVDGPTYVTSATIAESRLEPVQPLEPETEEPPAPPAPKATPAPPAPKATPPPISAPVPQPEHKSTPPRASPRPQMEQQVAQESMAATKPPPPPTTLLSTNGRPKPTKTIDEIETAPLTANDELDFASSAPSTPPVPPRRKRESKVSRIAKFFRTLCTIL